MVAANFSLNGGVSVLGATLAANQRDVVLTTTAQPAGTPLTLTVTNIRDSSPSANLIVPGSTIAVSAPVLPPEIVTNVGAPSNGYQLVYSLNLPVTGNLNAANQYTMDDRGTFGPYTRVAYYLELQKPGGPVQFVWVAMDPFTANRGKLGIPLASTGAIYQQNVTNLDVISNVAGVVNGTGLTGGNIEFWPTDYSAANGAAVPNASATTYDFGDTRTTTGNYGSMQVHNHDASQVVFAINHFGLDGLPLEVGIGNQAGGNPDYTFANNAGTYSRRVLHVLVLPGATTAPAVTAVAPEAANYQLVYSLNIPATGNLTSGTGFTAYTVDNRNDVGPFSRVAYFLELQKTGDATSQYVWVSMDAFTPLASRIGVPNLASGAFFQQNVTNLNVFSNAPGIVTGTNLTGGNIEFWPSNYNGTNPTNVPNASATNFDWGDGGAGTGAGYGSMQVHNHDASQVIFALNNWGAANNTANALCVGIGNGAAPNVDWTFANNAGTFDLKKVLQVYVLPGNMDLTGPAITYARGSTTLNRLVVTFNEVVADSAANAANFSIPGLTVTGATLLANQRDLLLTTSAQAAGATYTVNVTGVRDRSPAGNVVAPGASTTFTAHTRPAVLTGIPDAAGYQLIYQLAIPTATPAWNVNTIPYLVEESKYGEASFDRVAYCLELDGNWVYASFDPFTNLLSKIGVPTTGVTGTPFQQNVAHMNVASNVGSIVTGTDLPTGNIEFWGGNYTAPNGLNVPNASATNFDWGDTMTAGGHGSMQIHNYGASQTLFGYNNWGNNVGAVSDLGIGNNPAPVNLGVDWTFSAAAGSYAVKNLYVLAHVTGAPSAGTPPTILSNPISRTIAIGGSTTFAVSATGAASYQWRFNGTPISSATDSWFTVSGATLPDAGAYDVVVKASGGASTTSLSATLTVGTPIIFSGYRFTTRKDTAALIPRSTLAAKASGGNGNPLTVLTVNAASTQGGTVALDAANVTYTPPADFLGTDSFGVTIKDAAGATVNGTVNVSVTSLVAVPAGQPAFGFRGDGKFDVLLTGNPGQSYDLQRSVDLTTVNPPNGWETIQTVVAGDDGLIPFLDAAPPASRAYYRIKTITP